MSHLIEPTWVSRLLLDNSFDSTWSEWLCHPTSMTKKFKKHCQRFRVRILYEGFNYAYPSEMRQLGFTKRQYVWIRETQLFGDGKLWMFARAAMPMTTLTGSELRLKFLGEHPLGHFIFTHRQMPRSSFEFAKINENHHFYMPSVYVEDKVGNTVSQDYLQQHENPHENPKVLLGRRSMFYLNNKPLLLTEIFAKDFLLYTSSSPS